MNDVLGKFCPVCGESRPAIVSKKVHITKNQRYRCEGCKTEFTIHVDSVDFTGNPILALFAHARKK